MPDTPLKRYDLSRYITGPLVSDIDSEGEWVRYEDLLAHIDALTAADGLGQALATAIEGGYSDESIDIARYTGDPIYHAVVWEIRKHRANLDGPKTQREPHDA